MINTGRNDPCPCGSGKKYKKCCLMSVEETEFEYRRLRQIEAGLIPKLTKFAFDNLGLEVVEEAWWNFNDDESVGNFDPESPMNMVFMPWFLFTWIFEIKLPGSFEYSETTVAEQFVKHNKSQVSSEEEMLLLSATRCPYTLCEVTEVRPGVGMTQYDLLRRVKFEVIERSASQTLKRGHIIYCATTEIAGLRSNMGTSPYPLPPTAKRAALDLRKWITDEIGGGEITAEHLHEFEREIRGLYLDSVSEMLTPPQLTNTDGDPFVPQKLYFDLKSADEAFHGLKDLAEGATESDLLKNATIKDGLIIKAEIPWNGGTKEARKRHGGSILLGLLKINENRLVVEVNSDCRAKRIRSLIKKRIADNATYKNSLIESIEPFLHEAWNAKAVSPAGLKLTTTFYNNDDSDFEAPDDEQPELQEFMKQIAKQHWETWFDLPVPALNDMTPREAAKTEDGRELLESLLLLYEHNENRSPDNLTNPDISALRRELGMD
jgi:hypothetical protein